MTIQSRRIFRPDDALDDHRQLVVFTHDTRLPDALRRLNLPADIRTIHRDALSNVWVTPH